ncbi:hypothetical protein [Filimonas effusa]|uniref:Uncharacterized protein n=1 Tax=Filimonas effusa TaxID=2508721 RepID=A0A4Q1DAR2_9BACT|nr:hypothetical protein [Filimonas effusa]RXK86514.1 hypothetical protein ESB13_06825 [Filimonas effusa]
MAKQGGPFIFEKTFGNISCYKRCGIGLVRCKSNLTAERWRKDPAFAGSRKSAGEIAKATVIAAPFYKLIPLSIRKYSLYRQFVGVAKKMLSRGTPISAIEETLALAVIRLRKLEALDQTQPGQEQISNAATAPPAFTIKLSAPSVKAFPSPKSLLPPHVIPHKSRYLRKRRTSGRSASAAALL